MTEKEWLACGDPLAMLEFGKPWMDLRKRRLFAVACCRRTVSNLTDAGKKALDAAEAFADGLISQQKLHDAWRSVGFSRAEQREHAAAAARAASASPSYDQTASAAAFAANTFAKKSGANDKLRKRECAVQAAILRDIFGNPFRPVRFSSSWRTDTAVALARTMYESREFGAMPILADALQDAGCDSEDVLSHCRGTEPHVRGCWVCDLVLDKA